ncbi:MAG: thioredoxin domain-containing protein [Deltaproteobacteria bacterium]|nr:thioredoxin domain-containing protein [Deltaproteobacteria bacterium]
MRKSLIISLLLVSFTSFSGCGNKKNDEKKSPAKKEINSKEKNKSTSDKPLLTMYVMSQCPYGVMAEMSVLPLYEMMGKHFDLRFEYIGNTGANGTFESLHGQSEVDGDIAQLCAQKINPEKMMEFLACQNRDAKNVNTNWQQCGKEAGINIEKLTACKNGKEGKDLLKASFKKSQDMKVEGSPTLYINDKLFKAGMSPWAIREELCKNMKKKSEHCTPYKGVEVIFFTDKRCDKCKQYERILDFIKRDLNQPSLKTVDYSSPEGKKLFADTGAKKLPMLLFGQNVKKDILTFKLFEKALKPVGNYFNFAGIQPIFDPKAEICDNGVDDDNNGKKDCDDDACSKSIVCRKETAGTLDVFIMSQCPYGAAAVVSMGEVLKNFKDEIKFNINYIASKRPDGSFDSLHGQSEVDENIRQLCAMKYYSKDMKYMDYLICRSKDYRNSKWELCAVNGIDPKVIKKCFDGDEGKNLLSENIKKAEELEIGGSPTWLSNNRYKFQGTSPEHIRTGFCKNNPKLKGCGKKLSSDAKVQGKCGN